MPCLPHTLHHFPLSDLVAKWQAEGMGMQVCDVRVCLAAFADHLYLFDSSLVGIRAVISELEGALRIAGQALPPEKCASGLQ